jgi:hypothetical protein
MVEVDFAWDPVEADKMVTTSVRLARTRVTRN